MKKNNNIDIDFTKDDPKFDSGLGYLMLLDQLIKLACNYLINNQIEEYHRTLESWYITAHYWFKEKEKLKPEDQRELKKLREDAKSLQVDVLIKYHEKLELLTNRAGLRLASSNKLPGVLQ